MKMYEFCIFYGIHFFVLQNKTLNYTLRHFLSKYYNCSHNFNHDEHLLLRNDENKFFFHGFNDFTVRISMFIIKLTIL